MSQDLRMAKVSESVAMAEPRPEFTKTWHPFSHDEVRQATEAACEKLGWKIGKREYSIRPGSKCLAAWEIFNGGELSIVDGISNRIIWRNAIDMTHSLAFGTAYEELVCSNLQLSEVRSWVTFRKHTGRLSIEEITFYAEASLRKLAPEFKRLQEWRLSLKQRKITYEQASMLTVFAMKRGYLPPSKFESFWDKFDGNASLYKDDAMTLFAWQNANTELMRENNMLVQLDKQKLLHYFLAYEVPILLAQSEDPRIQIVNPQIAIDNGFQSYRKETIAAKKLLKESSSDLREEWKEQQKEKKKEENIKNAEVEERQKMLKKKIQKVGDELVKEAKQIKKKSAPKAQRASTAKRVEVESEKKKIRRSKAMKKCSNCGSLFDKTKHKKDCPSCGEIV